MSKDYTASNLPIRSLGYYCDLSSFKTRPYHSPIIQGIFQNIRYSVHMNYNKTEPVDWIEWFCPVHATPLHRNRINAPKLPSSVYHELRCLKCDKPIKMIKKDAEIYIEEAERMISSSIMAKLNRFK